jgi:thioredoxin reductase (NADPH)
MFECRRESATCQMAVRRPRNRDKLEPMDPVIIGPLIAGGFLAFVILIKVVASSRKKDPGPQKKVRLLIHSINDDRCTGCDACVLVCPTDVLELKSNKSRVLRFGDCIQCEQCANVCPTSALVMHYEGTEAPPVLVPDLDEYYQSKVPGLYLLGEAAGKPLVKNAVNLGRAVIEHTLRSGLRPGAIAQMSTPQMQCFDVAIIGSGPAGLSAALSCIQRRLSYVVLEKDAFVASTIARYPKGKKVMAEPYDVRCVGLLPVWDSTKEQAIVEWNRILEQVDMNLHTKEVVEAVRNEGATFVIKSDKGSYRAQRVLLCIGTRGKPRRLNAPGEDQNFIQPLLDDPEKYQGQTILVVGGGDSAVEAAIALSAPELRNKIILSYRGKQFNRVKAKNRQDLEVAQNAQRVLVLFGSNVQEFTKNGVTLKLADNRMRPIPLQSAFVLIGGDPPVKWLESMGIQYVQRPHAYQRGATDQLVERMIGRQNENNRPGQPVSKELLFDAAQAPMAAGSYSDRPVVAQPARKKEATIMVPKEAFLLHLPEKIKIEGEVHKVSELGR